MTPLHKAPKYGKLSVVKLLMERPEISGHQRSNEKFGRLPMQMAAKYRHLKVVEYFLATDEDLVNAVDNNGKTVLHHALFEGTPQTIESLLKHKNIKSDMRDKQGRTPLWDAIENDLSSAFSILCQRSDIEQDLMDSDGRRPKNGGNRAQSLIAPGF